MKWKSNRIKSEWDAMISGESPDALVPVALYGDAISQEISGKEAIITGIGRTDEEQLAMIRLINEQRKAKGLPLWPEDKKSVHQYFRGIDFRNWIYTTKERTKLIRRTNKRFIYGRGLSVLKSHPRGTAGHLHGQVPGIAEWKM